MQKSDKRVIKEYQKASSEEKYLDFQMKIWYIYNDKILLEFK